MAQIATDIDKRVGEPQSMCRLQMNTNPNDPTKKKCSNITSLEMLPEKNVLLAFKKLSVKIEDTPACWSSKTASL